MMRNGTLKFQREDRERGRQIREGYEKTHFQPLPVLYSDSPGGAAIARWPLR